MPRRAGRRATGESPPQERASPSISTLSSEDQCKTKGTARKVRPLDAEAVLSRVTACIVSAISAATATVEAREMARPYQNPGPKIHTKGTCSSTNRGGKLETT